jgi:acyl dehydratase
MGRYWEEFSIGDRFETSGRTITETDVIAFAALSGDLNPLHTNIEYCRTLGMEGLQPQTNLIIAITAGLIGRLGLFEQTALALVSMGWTSASGVKIGDTIRCVMSITRLTEVSSDVGSLLREVSIVNQHDEVVQMGWHEIHLRRSER